MISICQSPKVDQILASIKELRLLPAKPDILKNTDTGPAVGLAAIEK